MKQRITPGQLNKLSKRSRGILWDWWITTDYPGVRPLLSIGQMIDFLEHIDIPHPFYEQASPGRDFMDYDLMALPGDKWCNKLWGTVVKVLEILEDLED